MPVEIKEATEADEDTVFLYLLEHFYPDEPLNSSVGRIPDCKQNCPPISFLIQRMSFVAVDKNDTTESVCGVALNHELILDGADEKWISVTNKDPKTAHGKAIKFFKHIDEKFYEAMAKLFPQAQDDNCLDVCILSVRSDHRRNGLAKELVERSVTKAQQAKCRFIRIDCSSAFSAALAKKNDFSIVYQQPYHQYKDDNGEVVFKVPLPHVNYACFLKELTS